MHFIFYTVAANSITSGVMSAVYDSIVTLVRYELRESAESNG